MVNKLAKEGCNLPIPSSFALTYLELYSLKKISKFGGVEGLPHSPLVCGNRPGLKCDDAPRLHSLTLLVVTSSASHSSARCQDHQTSPEHMMVAWISQANISILKVNDLKDLV
ncbi:hypothetical protein TNCV_1426041 [Trichonephila clavipes]|nr:hypothetical protein TNCV_1426041 [Trichonephila clavipes]